jgi:hypothetical protein
MICDRWSADSAASGTNRSQGVTGATGNHLPLPLGRRGDDVGDERTGRACGINIDIDDNKAAVGLLRHPSHERREVVDAPAQPVELSCDQNVRFSRTDSSKCGLKARAVETGTTLAFVYEELGFRPIPSLALGENGGPLGFQSGGTFSLLAGRASRVGEDAGHFLLHENLHRIRQSHHTSRQVAAASSVRVPLPLWMDKAL